MSRSSFVGIAVGLAALATACQGIAHAQVLADPDYWKATSERQDIVTRFVCSQSPQAIPPTYDPVRDAEEIVTFFMPPGPPPADFDYWYAQCSS